MVTSIEYPGSHINDFDSRFYNGFYHDYGFGQVFFPTKGILASHSKATGKLRPLPGADDPAYTQAAAFWSPDGKYLVFSRAAAKEPYRDGQGVAQDANSPAETQIQYDLYRIPFNEGRGGTPERIDGASQNGMSNNFPKVSPDGRWIVFVQNRNGLGIILPTLSTSKVNWNRRSSSTANPLNWIARMPRPLPVCRRRSLTPGI